MDSLLEPTLLLVNVDRQILPGHVVAWSRSVGVERRLRWPRGKYDTGREHPALALIFHPFRAASLPEYLGWAI